MHATLARAAERPMGFVGQRDPALEALYLYLSGFGYFVRDNQNPVRYVNC